MSMHTSTGFLFGDLDAQAQSRALATVQHQLLDQGSEIDCGELAATVGSILAQLLQTPAGRCDVEILVWSPHRSRHVTFDGVLAREQAPALPWSSHLHAVRLTGCGQVAVDIDGAAAGEDVAAMRAATQDAVATAWYAAVQRMLRCQALELIAGTEPVFNEAGDLIPVAAPGSQPPVHGPHPAASETADDGGQLASGLAR